MKLEYAQLCPVTVAITATVIFVGNLVSYTQFPSISLVENKLQGK